VSQGPCAIGQHLMKFCADISPLDIECSILDIHYLFCQTPTIPPPAWIGGAQQHQPNAGSWFLLRGG
ncbi:MAG: hypothetical protein NTV22_08560, partial [bacterium]|nr:hypothetical protein [bacterium]